jgi:putative transcriptional regulator
MEVRGLLFARPSLCSAAAAIVLLGAAVWAAEPADAPTQNTRTAGQLLVATPELEGPVFSRTVVYMVRHDARTGAMGLIVNRKLGEVPMAVLLKQSGLPDEGAKGSVRLHVGGPVEATRIFVLHTDDYTGPDTVKVGGGIAISSDSSILKAITGGKGPRRSRFTLGFAGWAPGQLEAEMQAGYWVVVPSDGEIVFDDAYETKWDRAMAKRRISL